MESPILRIFVIIDTIELSGPAKGLLQLVETGKSQGVEFVVCAFSYPHNTSTPFIEELKTRGIPLQILFQSSRFHPGFIWQAFRYFKQSNCSLIQTHGYKTHLLGFLISRSTHTPWVAVSHGWTREDRKVIYYNSLERLLLRFPEEAITVSPPLFQEISKIRGPNKCSTLIENAVNPQDIPSLGNSSEIRAKYLSHPQGLLLGCFGRLSHEKGQIFLLRALPEVLKKIPQLCLLFLGNGPEKESLERLATELGVAAHVQFLPYQNNIGDYYAAIDMLVIPSLSEGLPNVALEAMSLGVPVLATSVGALPELIQHGQNGYLLNPGDSKQLALELGNLLQKPEQLRLIGAKAKQALFPRFSTQERFSKFLKTYRKNFGIQIP